MTSLVPQSFIPGYRLQSGTDLNEALANPQWSTSMTFEATTGGTAATSAKIVNTITNITSATAGAGVTVPRSAIGKYLHIINSTANTVNVYAEGDATINGVAGTFGYDLPAGQSITLYGVDTTSWLIDDASGGAQDYFDTIAALKAVTPTAGQFAEVGGYYAVGDGGGGQFYGVTQPAVFTGSISGTGDSALLTVTSVTSGQIYQGMSLSDVAGDILAGTTVLRQVTGTIGGAGLYELTMPANASFTGNIPALSSSLTVSGVTGTIDIGQTVGGNLLLVPDRNITGYSNPTWTLNSPVTNAVVNQPMTANSPISSRTITGKFVENFGTVILPTGGDGTSAWIRFYNGVINVKWFGAKGDNTTDDTAAIRRAAIFANSAKRSTVSVSETTQSLGTNIFHPGLTLDFGSGVYYLAFNAPNNTEIPIECDVVHSGAGLRVDVAYTGTAIRIGMDVFGYLLSTANINMPDVYKPTLSPEPYTGTGIRIKNLNASEVRLGRVDYFDKCHHFGGKGQGTVYCDIYLGQSAYGKTFVYIVPETGGWFNINNVFGGNFRQGGNRKTGYYHIYMDGTGTNTVVDNNFYGMGLEGNGAQYMVYGKNAANNNWYGTYVETGVAPLYVSVDASGGATSTITCTGNHGLSAGSMVSVIANLTGYPAGTLPSQLLETTPYYVLASGLTATQFELSLNKGGTAISFPSGTYNFYSFFQSEALFEGVGGAFTANNIFNDTYLGSSYFLNVVSTGPATNNGMRSKGVISTRSNYANDIPPFRGANATFTAGLTLAQFAAYGPAYDPDTQPSLWSTALSPNGIYYKDPAANTLNGRLFCTFGSMRFNSGTSTALRDIPSAVRSGTYTSVTVSVPANDGVTQTITLTGAAVGDFVVIQYAAALPNGIVQAWAMVTATDTVSVRFQNVTGSPISLTSFLIGALVYSRFY